MKIIVFHKEPIIDRIPNLKSFIFRASQLGHKVLIITTSSKKYPIPSFLSANITCKAVDERIHRFQSPTVFRFYSLCFFVLISNAFSDYKLILGGKYALIFGYFLRLVSSKKFIGFIIEYPELLEGKSILDEFECNGIKLCSKLITHDKLHAEFIAEKLNILNLDYSCIPNGTIGPAKTIQSNFLHNRLNINSNLKIILHSGGFGPWFDSVQLANSSSMLGNDFRLVFHISHSIENDKYYIDYLKSRDSNDETLFSMRPVATDELDALVASAYIGIAWYSTDVLGYRATMLGLSAGKVGNYLKCGIPVIVPDYESFSYIDDYCCGVRINNLSSLKLAISKIENNYQYYSINAINCYDKLWDTTKYCDNLCDELISV